VLILGINEKNINNDGSILFAGGNLGCRLEIYKYKN